MPITLKQVRTADWRLIYSPKTANNYKVFACDIEHLNVIHYRKPGGRTVITYVACGQVFDSAIMAVRFWNAKEKHRTQAAIDRRDQVRTGPEQAAT